MPMYSLVTGGAGFIGSHLCDHLLKLGHNVVCCDDLSLGKKDNISHNLNNPNFVFIQVNILDRLSFQDIFQTYKIDTVFHLAANSDIKAGSENLDRDLTITFNTTVECLYAAKNFNVKSFVFASSSAVYGRFDEDMKETSGPLNPVSFYGAAKLASEVYIHAMLEQTNMKAWIIRFPNVVGERLTHGVIHDFIKKLEIEPKKLEILGNGKQKKPYVYVSDIVRGIVFSLTTMTEKYNVINIGVDSQTTVSAIAAMVAEEMKLSNVKFNYSGGEGGWIGDVSKFQYDLSKIHKLGWKASMSSDEAVRYSIQQELAYQNK